MAFNEIKDKPAGINGRDMKETQNIELEKAINKESMTDNSNDPKVVLDPKNIGHTLKERLIGWVVERYYHFF